jgi:hypothetical protein
LFRIFLSPRDITFKLLRKSTLYFGYNPRVCFDASNCVERLKSKALGLTGNIGFTAIDTNHILHALHSYQMGDDAFYDAIFQLFPTDELRSLETCHYEPVSPWVFRSLLEVCEIQSREADSAANLDRKLLWEPWAGVAPGPGPSVRNPGIELLEWD